MGNDAQDMVAIAAILGSETGSIPRAEVIISFVDDSHETFVPYGHVSFVKEVYPDDSFLVSETNVDGRRFSQADSAMNFAYTTKRRVFTWNFLIFWWLIVYVSHFFIIKKLAFYHLNW